MEGIGIIVHAVNPDDNIVRVFHINGRPDRQPKARTISGHKNLIFCFEMRHDRFRHR
mgnify:CR=1 FL=1